MVDHGLASYAHGPASGHFLIIQVRLTNLSSSGLQVDPAGFELTTSGGTHRTVNDGNAPYSGASHVLDPTFLVSRGSEHGPLIYDTPQLHGRIVYAPSGHAACTWTF